MTGTNKLNFDRICRACLRETSPMKDLFEVKTTVSTNLHDMIMACASVEVSIEDGLPTNICVNCESDVAIAYKFKQTCEKSDNYLRNYIAERKSIKNTQFIKKEIKEEYIEPEVTLHEIRGADDDTSSIDYNDTDESYESKRFKCNLCNKTLSTAESLRHHKKIHRNIHYLCGYCDKKATRLFDLKRHIGNKHNDGKIQKVFDCKKCLKAFLNEQQLEEHECLYKSEEHQLFGDSYFSDDEQRIKKEVDDENKTNEPPPILYTCDVCNKSFKMKKVLSRHKIRVHRTKLHICKTCGKKFPFETALDRHVNHKHKLSFLCPECGRNFTKARYLEKHLDTHKRNPTSHTCEVCNKTFSGLNHLIVHRRTHDKFKNKANNAEVENGKKTVLCSVCGKGCSSRSNLSVHMRRHTGQMSHVCSICSKGYPRSTDLKLHMRSHTGEKPYVCTVCGRAFARADKLRIHTRTHTGEKPYACPCGKAFAQSNDLTKHKRIGKCIFTAPSQGLVTMSEIQRDGMAHADVRDDARRNTVPALNLLRLGLN